MRQGEFEPLLEPFVLKHLQLRNRFVSTSHEPGYAHDGMPTGRYRQYHVEKAKGGVALTMIGGSAVVAPDSPATFGNLHVYDDSIVPWLDELAAAVHEEGALVMCQLTHLGPAGSNYAGDWLPSLAASARWRPPTHAIVKIAEPWDLDRTAEAFASAAQRCKDGGLDGVELQASGGLLGSFLSPATNSRDDDWGGSLQNRLRFPLQVIKAVRTAVGDHFVVGVRMALDDRRPGGIDKDEGLLIARYLIKSGIDVISVLRGNDDTDWGHSQIAPSMGTPMAPHLEFVGSVKRELSVPVMHAGRIIDLNVARHAVQTGLLDLVGMVRPLMADPYLIAKLMSGETRRIRPCVGASYCSDTAPSQGSRCIHNPSTGREENLPHIVPATTGPIMRAVVVGAGPAGLEAARVLAERGHTVRLLEAQATPGGQLRLAAMLPRRREMMGIIEWRAEECKRLGVEIEYNVVATQATVLAGEPDVVIVATGGLPDLGFLAAGAELVSDTWAILDASREMRGRVLLFDDNGGYPGVEAAEALALNGAKVEFVSPERTIAPGIGMINYPEVLEAFDRLGVLVTLGYRLISVAREKAGLVGTMVNQYSGQQIQRVVDDVVVEHGTRPQASLYFDLLPESSNLGVVDHEALLGVRPQPVGSNQPGRYRLFRVGDAVTSRNVHAAVLEGFRLCVAM
ncbi:MAG: FAD-dependent oxidoreductase [Candidatus Dormiibacterota bacterium]